MEKDRKVPAFPFMKRQEKNSSGLATGMGPPRRIYVMLLRQSFKGFEGSGSWAEQDM